MGTSCYRGIKPTLLPDKSERISLPSPPVIQTSSIESLPDGITLIWLDEYAGKSSEDGKTTLYYLRQLNVASIRLCNDVNSCLSFIKSISYNEKTQYSQIFLITSGVFSSEILPQLKSFPIINSVFTFLYRSIKIYSINK